MKFLTLAGLAFFALLKNACGEYSYQIFYSFGPSNSAPHNPNTGLTQGANGKLYGGASYSPLSSDAARIFRISFDGKLTNVPVYLPGSGNSSLGGKLLQSQDGNLYGVTTPPSPVQGGTLGGTLFRLAPDDSATIVAAFWGTNGTGSQPVGTLIQTSDGSLMGATFSGGIGDTGIISGFRGLGTIFQFGTNGIFSGLRSFALNRTTGFAPRGGLIEASDGNLYGTTSDLVYQGYATPTAGRIFRISLQGFETLFTFYGTNGFVPSGSLLQAQDGALYGTTMGTPYGTVFKITTNAVFTSLFSFFGTNGTNPTGDLIQLNDGNLYGTTTAGGSNNLGTIFRITTNGVLTSIFSFKSSTGASPLGGLCLARDGNLYGTTSTGGPAGGGTIFRLVQSPAATSITQSNDLVTLNWASFTGAVYRVEYRTNLTLGTWLTLAPTVPSAGNTTAFTDSISSDPQRYYRVVLLPH
jgi:uncharacterized repeat protein (TIGR03803 family)